MKALKTCTANIVSFFIMANLCRAATFYVDNQQPSADDANPGTVILPWKTIQRAASTLVAGDTVFIRQGTYSEQIYLENAGNTSEGSIVFIAHPGEKPVIDGSALNGINNGVVIDKSYIVIRGLDIRNWPGNGIWIENASRFEIADCEVHDVACGIGVADGCSDFLFTRVLVHHFDLYGIDVTSSSQNPCHNGTFNDCIAHTCRDPEQNVDGFALGHGNQHDFVFNRCTTYNVYDGFDISSRNTRLDRCLAYNCANGCYKLWQDQIFMVNSIGFASPGSIVELDWDNQPGRITLTNCTFFNAQTFTIWIENKADTLQMTNCILAGGDNIGLCFEQMGTGNYRGDYNLFQNDNPNRLVVVAYTDEFDLDQVKGGTWRSYSGQDAHSLVMTTTDSIFANPATNDLRLRSGCMAIDHGTNQDAPADDYDGGSRPLGAGYDMGAYEFGHITDIGCEDKSHYAPTGLSLEQNFPNPFNSSTEIRFEIPEECLTRLTIVDLRGRLMRTLLNEIKKPAVYSIRWDGKDDGGVVLPSGVYLYCLVTDDVSKMRKLALVK